MDSFMLAYSDHDSVSAYSDPNVLGRFQFKDTSLDYDIVDLPLTSDVPDHVIHSTDLSKRLDTGSAEENDFSGAILRYINQVLMEDDLENVAFTIQNSTLHATEQSLYEILNKKDQSSPNQPLPHEGARSSSDDSISHCRSNCHINTNNLVESESFCSSSCSCHTAAGIVESLVKAPPESRSNWRFNGGTKVQGKAESEEDEGDLPHGLLMRRKSLHREESDYSEEGKSKKHLAVGEEESVLHEIFDKVMYLYGKNDEGALSTCDGALPNGESQKIEHAKGSRGKRSYTRKGVSKREAIGMRSLLLKCMQSVAGDDYRSARRQLKQIRLHSSPLGDGSQRLAHYFANSLEARLLGSGSQNYKSLDTKMSDADVFNAYKLYLSSMPFMETSYFFADQVILKLAEKATSIHIIHFGIMHGLQWPPLIQRLSTRPGGPPKLRITGIDLPQSGFRPFARVRETGCRLANYCERFNVPFEYHEIARPWETISVEDLRLEKDEVLVVNCFHWFMYLLDDTIMENSPRDAVLNLIKKISPDIFIHGVINGTYNSPFFDTRFREALFYYSAVFDMYDANLPRENQQRMMFERDILGNLFLNVIACEGSERVVRPESYKQWQIRTLRAGLRQLPLNQEIMKELRAKVKSCYHKGFFVDEASQWMLAGWKGRVMIAFSCWKSDQESCKISSNNSQYVA